MKSPIVRLLSGVILGAVAVLLSLALGGGHVGSVLQLEGFLLVVGGTAALLLIAFPKTQHLAALRAALGSGHIEHATSTAARRYFATMGQSFLLTGLAGSILGVMQAVANVASPDKIGPAIALAFLSTFYGFLLRIFVAGALHDTVASRG